MSNVQSIKTVVPANPAMAEAFQKAAEKASPGIGGDTLQAESINMTERSETSTQHYAKVMAELTSDKGSNAMHETNGEDSQMFVDVKEIAEPVFTGKHGTLKRQAIAAAASVAGTAIAYSLLTGDSKRLKAAVITNVSMSAVIAGSGAVKRSITKRTDPLDNKKLTWKEALKIAGLNVAVSVGMCSLGIFLVNKASSSVDVE